MQALEPWPRFVLGFVCGCLPSSAYGFVAVTWRFGVIEAIWVVIAVGRYGGIQRQGAG